jgi:hypothetical protein
MESAKHLMSVLSHKHPEAKIGDTGTMSVTASDQTTEEYAHKHLWKPDRGLTFCAERSRFQTRLTLQSVD